MGGFSGIVGFIMVEEVQTMKDKLKDGLRLPVLMDALGLDLSTR
jgi:hypothetical protein